MALISIIAGYVDWQCTCHSGDMAQSAEILVPTNYELCR